VRVRVGSRSRAIREAWGGQLFGDRSGQLFDGQTQQLRDRWSETKDELESWSVDIDAMLGRLRSQEAAKQ
ncbi:MAG: hypothetical protein ACYC1R_04715, partial [Coriobacteriia bacterium]